MTCASGFLSTGRSMGLSVRACALAARRAQISAFLVQLFYEYVFISMNTNFLRDSLHEYERVRDA